MRLSFRRPWPALVLAPLLMLAVAPPRALASITEALDLRALVQSADVVMVGSVVGTEATRDDLGRIVTDARVRTDEGMRGARTGELVVVRSLGGVIGDLGLRVEGEASLSPGERVVLFARRVSGASGVVLRPVGMSQGVLPMAEQSGTTMVMPGGAGLSMVTRDASGRLSPTSGALAVPMPADEVLATIRDLVAEIHGAR